jgi:hypothetical protein
VIPLHQPWLKVYRRGLKVAATPSHFTSFHINGIEFAATLFPSTEMASRLVKPYDTAIFPRRWYLFNQCLDPEFSLLEPPARLLELGPGCAGGQSTKSCRKATSCLRIVDVEHSKHLKIRTFAQPGSVWRDSDNPCLKLRALGAQGPNR